MKTVTKWKKEHEFESRQEHHTIQIDGSRRHAISPKALLLSALAGCSGVDIVDILKKMRIDFTELEIEAETTQTEATPKVFRDIHITYIIRTDKKNEKNVIKAIELSLGKYCGVSAMLKKNSAINYSLLIKEGNT